MTEKKMKELIHKVNFHFHQLENALNKAHRADLIKYENYTTEAPCASIWEARKRFKLTTKEKIADIIQMASTDAIERKEWKR